MRLFALVSPKSHVWTPPKSRNAESKLDGCDEHPVREGLGKRKLELQLDQLPRRVLFLPNFAELRRFGQDKNYNFFASASTDVVVQTVDFHSRNALDKRC